jgi:anti-anti-sigma factor
MADVGVTTWLQDAVIYQIGVERLFMDSDVSRVRGELRDLIGKTPRIKLAIDFSLVGAVSSRFLGILVELRKLIADAAGTISLFGLQPKVRRVIEVTRMDKLLPIRGTQEEALRDLRKQVG